MESDAEQKYLANGLGADHVSSELTATSYPVCPANAGQETDAAVEWPSPR